MTEVRKYLRIVRGTNLFIAGFLIAVLGALTAFAEIRVIETESVYPVEDGAGTVYARRIALLDANYKALERAAAFAEGLASVKDRQLSTVEISAYTAGVIETEVLADEAKSSGQGTEAYIKIRSTLDTDILLTAIGRYRQQEELEGQLEASVREHDKLRKERADLLKQLASSRDRAKTEKTRLKLDAVLTREETNREIHKLWTNLAYVLSEQDDQDAELAPEDLDRSAKVLEQAVRIDPKSQRAHCLLAGVYQKKGNHAGAEREARTAIQRNPSNPIPHLKLGILLQARGKNDEALKEFHFVERLRPHNPVMLYYMGITLKDMKRCGLSIQYLQRFLKDKQIGIFPQKAERARIAISECGGARGGYQRRVKSN
ncbi:MAG: hypothetical protein A2078_11330 [Nitrospirae bacterium GWC2_57_9]|nr:MAG: hypothetical protein A2078_11330 [Nitrospirae bacterium GWC2_57_9]